MSHKFIKTAFKDDCVMIKVVIEGKEVWAECTKPVKEFAKKNFQEGDDVDFEFELKDKSYKITGKITKVGGQSAPDTSNKAGKDTYTPPATGGTVNESIKRQAVAHATSRVMIALQGHVNPNNVKEIFNTVYDVILTKVG